MSDPLLFVEGSDGKVRRVHEARRLLWIRGDNYGHRSPHGVACPTCAAPAHCLCEDAEGIAHRDLKPDMPLIADDVAALKDLLAWMRAEHWTVTGMVTLGRIQLAGLIDDSPRARHEREHNGEAPLPMPGDESDPFR